MTQPRSSPRSNTRSKRREASTGWAGADETEDTMTLQDAQSVLDMMADTVIQTGGSPDGVAVEFYAQDGILNRITFEWKVDKCTFSTEWRAR